MKFCTNCGKPAELDKSEVKCSCGFTNIIDSKTSFTEKIKKPEERSKGIFIPEKFKEKGFPHTCEKCNHKYADVVDLGSFYSDESNIYLFRCKKCNHVSRDAK